MASIRARARSDGTLAYQVGYYVGSKLAWSPTMDRAEDAAWLKDMIERLGHEATLAILTHRTGSAVSVPTLREWTTKHLGLLAASATPGTIADYQRMAERTWMPRLGDWPLDAITREVITEWVAWQRQQPSRTGRTYAPKSITNAHGLLSAVLTSAVDAGHAPKNIARGVPLPSDQTCEEMTFLTEGEFIRVLGEIPLHFRPLVLTLVGTGMRWGEATALTVAELDLDSRQPAVRITQAWKKGATGVYLGSPKTRRGRRTVSIPEQVVDALRPLVAGKRPGDRVFTSVQGKRIQAQHFRERVWHPAVQRADIGKAPRVHDLRHTHASWMIARGMNLTTLQRRLGHESITTTSDRYGHLEPEAQIQAAASATLSLAGWLPQIES